MSCVSVCLCLCLCLLGLQRCNGYSRSQDANDTITDIEHWHCENCGGLPRQMHPRPPEAKRTRASFDPDLPVPTEALLPGRLCSMPLKWGMGRTLADADRDVTAGWRRRWSSYKCPLPT